MNFRETFTNLPSKTKSLMGFGIIIALTVALPLFIWALINMTFDVREKAQSVQPNATLRFEPTQATIPTQTEYDIWIDSDNSVSFAAITLNFDKDLINLSQEITYTDKLDKEIITTTKDQANSNGQLELIRGLSPENISNGPSGSFKVASITLESKTNNDNVATSISFANNCQIVATDEAVFNLTTNNLVITLNPVSTSTPTSSSTASATIAPTPTSTSISTASPTAIPTASNKLGDVNNDGVINIIDLGIVIEHYAENTNDYSKGDVNNDSVVNIIDIGIIIDNYIY